MIDASLKSILDGYLLISHGSWLMIMNWPWPEGRDRAPRDPTGNPVSDPALPGHGQVMHEP